MFCSNQSDRFNHKGSSTLAPGYANCSCLEIYVPGYYRRNVRMFAIVKLNVAQQMLEGGPKIGRGPSTCCAAPAGNTAGATDPLWNRIYSAMNLAMIFSASAVISRSSRSAAALAFADCSAASAMADSSPGLSRTI
jgi:hypothetical protein